MVEKDCEWILPENLRMQEIRERTLVDRKELKGVGDFGAFYAFRTGVNCDLIKPHAITEDGVAGLYVDGLKDWLNKQGFNLAGKSILDLGCAMGAITGAFRANNKGANVVGVDISSDAIEYAVNHYPLCTFYCQSATDLDNVPDESYDIVHAKEFYPFTRTDDAEYQLEYFRTFHRILKADGVICLAMFAVSRGLCNTYRALIPELKKIGYQSFTMKETMVPLKMYKLFRSLTYNDLLYQAFSAATNSIMKLRGASPTYLYLIRK